MNTSPVRVGIIGAGRIGRVHAQALATRIDDARVEMISDVRLEAARQAAAEFRIPKATEDYREILRSPEISAVLICSPTDTHATLIEEASAAGKHIFCEKPIDLSLARIEAALAAVKKAGVKLQVGFNRRFDPNFRKIAEGIRAGKIGVPHLVRITSRDPQPPPLEYVQASGGLFLDMTIHDFDMARYIIQDEPEEVFAVAGNLIDPSIQKAGDVDTAVVTLKYRSGALCTIDNSRKAVYGYDQRVEVLGSKGCMKKENNTPTRAQFWDADGQHEDLPLFFFLERYTESYVSELREFVDCVRNDREPSCSGRDGLQAVILGLAAKRSLDEKRPVRVSEIGLGE
jgi:myo-inositol 2-dehydrogenase / D-chiro-inositol 1-dehydrogenase